MLALANGLDKFTVVIGPFLLVASLFSVLRQTDRLSMNLEVPMLVITFGVLMLIARVSPLPTPAWLAEPDADRSA